jgi:ankyrin repeat protein
MAAVVEALRLGNAVAVVFLARTPTFDPNERAGEWTPLTYAAFKGNVAAAEALLDAGAEINLRNTRLGGATPLREAVNSRSDEMWHFLRQRGADLS